MAESDEVVRLLDRANELLIGLVDNAWRTEDEDTAYLYEDALEEVRYALEKVVKARD